MTVDDLPTLNASLNALSAALAIAGFVCVKRRKITAHKALMLAAVFTSACFLTSYVIFHLTGEAKRFAGAGWLRLAYFAMLISHVVLAVAVVPMVLASVYYGLRNRLARHVRIARWALGIWLYVSITGVTVYFSLY